jgi:CHAT domain-containing protein
VVDQKGVDVTVTLVGPDGRRLRTVDTPNGRQGPEPVPVVAATAGRYFLEVTSPEPNARSRYAVRVEALRPATDSDRQRVAAEDLLAVRTPLEAAAARQLQALQIVQALGDRGREAEVLSILGSTHRDLQRPREALGFYRQALALFRARGEERRAVSTLQNLGRLHQTLGEPETALACNEEALALARRLGDRATEAWTLQLRGSVREALGDFEGALESDEQALSLWRSLGDRRHAAKALLDLASVQQSLGQIAPSLDTARRALAALSPEESPRDSAEALRLIGDAEARSGQPAQAFEHLHRALVIQRKENDRRGEGLTLNDLGWTYIVNGQWQQAHIALSQALIRFQELDDRPTEAIVLAHLGWTENELRRPQVAEEDCGRALPVLAALRDPIEANAFLCLGEARRRRGDLTGARQAVEAGIERIEAQRSAAAGPAARTSFFASKQWFYETEIALLMAGGHAAEALAMSEQARARGLLDLLAAAHADLRQGVDPALLHREEELRAQINAADRRRRSGTGTEADLRRLLDQLDRAQAAIRRASPRYAALTQPRPLSLREIQRQVLDGDTLLLEYALGREKSFLWAVTPETLDSFELPPRAEIEEAVRSAIALLTAPDRTLARRPTETALVELSRTLLGPAAGLLQSKRLVIAGDGALLYLPFAALPVPKRFNSEESLIDQHEIVTLPSASSLAVLRRDTDGRPPAPETLAVVADPTFAKADPRAPRFAPLPYARQEAETILQEAPPDSRFAALGSEASRATVLSGRLAHYRIVHFATHGVLDTANPELSGIALAQVDREGRLLDDGFLRAHEIYGLHLPADLVVLSACRTALGPVIRGEGLAGMTRGFFYAGARSVLVSLWEVDDQATAELMRLMYRGMLHDHRPPAAALRAAQTALRREPGWESPTFWAGFVLQGDWRQEHERRDP